MVDLERLMRDGGAMASTLSTDKRSHAQISSIRITLQKLSFRKPTRCLREYLRRRAKTACRWSTGRRHRASRGPPKKIGACGESKYVLQGGACEPRVHVRHWGMKAVCFSSSVTVIIAKTVQLCNRGRRLLHLPRRS